jgi:nitrate reductase gamma subunit
MSYKHTFIFNVNRTIFICLVISFVFAGINTFVNPAGVLAGIPAGLFCLSLGYFVGSFVSFIRVEEHDKLRIARIEEKAEKEPENNRYAWDAARIRLEAYFDRNLIQVKLIFWISVLVILFGFALIAYGVSISLHSSEKNSIIIIAVLTGVLTEFLGATLMLIFRSTIQSANSYLPTLERINSVGMAIQIIDSMPEHQSDLRNQAKSEISKLIISSGR